MQILKALSCQKITESQIQQSYTKKYQKHIACSYGYKLVCLDKFSKPFKAYIGKDAVYNLLNNMIKQSQYCSQVMKKSFNKELVMTKEDKETLQTLLNIGSVCMYGYMYIREIR